MQNDKPNRDTVHLLARFRDGERAALNELFGRYYDRVLAVVCLRLGPKLRAKVEAHDVAQEVFMSSLQGLGNFVYRNEGDFFHWLCKMVENRIRDQADYFSAQKRDMGREVPLAPRRPSVESLYGPLREFATTTSPATRAARAESTRRLVAAIDTLPPLQREALILVRYEGMSLTEASTHLGRSADAVRMLVARAVVSLGKNLGVTADNGTSGGP